MAGLDLTLSRLVLNTTMSAVSTTAGFPLATVGVAGAAGVLFLAALVSWGMMRAWVVSYQLSELATQESLLALRLENFVYAALLLAWAQARGLLEAIQSVYDAIRANLLYLIVGFVIALAAIVWWFGHPALISGSLETNQCLVRPLVDDTVLPLASTARLLYSVLWPGFVNPGTEIVSFFTWGQFRVLFACADLSTLTSTVYALGRAVGDLLSALVSWLTSGMLADPTLPTSRIAILPVMVDIGLAFDPVRTVLNCFCRALMPLFDVVLAVPQLASLHTAVDCAGNVGARFIQWLLSVFITLSFPTVAPLSAELQCTVYATGDLAEDLWQLFAEFAYGMFTLVEELIGAATVTHTSLNAAYVEASTLAGAGNASHIPRGLRVLSATWHAAAGSYKGASTALLPHLDPFTLWTILDLVELKLFLGIDVLLALAATPWSRIITGPVVAGLAIVNASVEAVTHPTQAFDSPDGLAYFQVGYIADPLRVAVDAVAQLLQVVDRSIPCLVSVPAQAILVSFPEMLVEAFFAFIYAQIFPPWLPGVPPPVNCSAAPCTCGYKSADCPSLPSTDPLDPPTWADLGRSPLDVFPALFDWPDSRGQRTLRDLREAGNCTAFALGCNTSALNNNSTNVTSNCTEAPFACLARGVENLAVELINQTSLVLFYLPDFLRFSPSYHTVRDVDLHRVAAAFMVLVDCVASYIDSLDEDQDMCLTNTAPLNRTLPGTNTTLPPVPDDDGLALSNQPPRYKYGCGNDGLAYLLPDFQPEQQALLMVLNQTIPAASFEFTQLCDPGAGRGCQVAGNAFAQILGNFPLNTTTVRVTPRRDWPKLPLSVVNNGFAPFVELVAPANYSAYHVTSVSPPSLCFGGIAALRDPFPVTTACRTNNSGGGAGLLVHVTALDNSQQGLTQQMHTLWNSDNGNFVSCGTSLAVDAWQGVYTCVASGSCGGNDCLFYTPPGYPPLAPRAALDSAGDQIGCTASSFLGQSKPVPIGQTCYRGRMVTIPFDLFYTSIPSFSPYEDIFSNHNLKVIEPSYYLEAVGHTRQPLPCFIRPGALPGYQCNATSHTAIWGPGDGDPVPLLEWHQDDPGNPTPVPCTNNPYILETTPVCGSITIQYDGGLEAKVAVYGSDIVVIINDTVQDMPCSIVNAEAAAAAGVVNIDSWDAPIMSHSARWHFDKASVRVRAEAERVDHRGPVMTPRDWLRLDASAALRAKYAASTAGRYLLTQLSAALVNLTNSTLYRKESFLCCLSDAVRYGGNFFIAFVFEALYTVQSILALPVFITEGIIVPTFSEARDDLKTALCRLSCAVTHIIPVTFECLAINHTIGCGGGDSCAANMLCAAADLVTSPFDIIVDTLSMIRALTSSPADFPAVNVLGPECSPARIGDCLASSLAYILTKIVFHLTLLVRSVAALGDCILCAFVKVFGDDADCFPFIFAVVDPLMDLVDGIVGSVVVTLLKFVIGVVTLVIDIIGLRPITTIINDISTLFNLLLSFISNIGQIIWEFLRKLPLVGDIIDFVYGLVRDLCDIVADIIDAAGGNPPDCDFKKRAAGEAAATGWLLVAGNPAIAAAWAGAAADSCPATRMNTLNGTDYAALTDLERQETVYCLAAYLWVGDAATPEAANSISECDQLMPALYAGSTLFSSLEVGTRTTAYTCAENRWRAELIRSRNPGSWMPHDVFYNPWRWLQLGDDLWTALDAWGQYARDRRTATSILLGAAYRAEAAGTWGNVSVAQLEALGNLTDASEADVRAALDADDADLGLAPGQYVARAIAARSAGNGRTYSQARVLALFDQLVRPIINGTEDGTSLTSYTGQILLAQMDAHVDVIDLGIPTVAQLFGGSGVDAHYDARVASDFVESVVWDLPSLGVRIVKAAQRVGDQMDDLRRALQTPVRVGEYLWKAYHGAWILARDMVRGSTWGGTFADAGLNLSAPGAVDPMYVVDSAQGAWQPMPPGQNGAAASGRTWLTSLGAAMLPTTTPFYHVTGLLKMALASTTTAAAYRRAGLSRFGATLVHAVAAQPCNAPNSTTPCDPALSPLPCRVDPVLCTECLYLDQMFGAIAHAFNTFVFFLGNTDASVEPSLAHSAAQFDFFVNYSREPSAVVIIGDSPDNPARWPWKDRPWTGILGDLTPNKRRLSDYAELWADTWALISDMIDENHVNNVTMTAASAGLVTASLQAARTARPNSPREGRPLVGQVADYLTVGLAGVKHVAERAGLVPTAAQLKQRQAAAAIKASSNPINNFTDFGGAFGTWAHIVWDTGFRCTFDVELDGSHKRFSIGEVVFFAAVVALVGALLLRALVFGDLFTAAGGGGAIFGLLLFFGVLWVAYDWSYFCTPALPAGLGDDLFYFLAFDLAPKCPVIGGGLINEPEYNNSNCYACERYMANTSGLRWTIPSFTQSRADGGRFGFSDVSYNLVFILHTEWPEALDWLTGPAQDLPLIGALLRLDFVATRLHAFDGFDPASASARDYSQFYLGNYVVTLVPNALILIGIIGLLALIWPLAVWLLGVLFALLMTAVSAMFYALAAMVLMGDAALGSGQPPPPREPAPGREDMPEAAAFFNDDADAVELDVFYDD